MGAFELNEDQNPAHGSLNSRRLREECIIAFKVYDSCRQQNCLTEKELGPARAAECILLGPDHINEGDIIRPPSHAAAVTIDKLRVKKIMIVNKEPNSFRNGFWDIDIKYVFEYRLTFREADGCPIGSVKANSIFNECVTLFGSIDSDTVIATDLFREVCESKTLDSDPFIMAEAKSVGLGAQIRHHCRHHGGRHEGPESEGGRHDRGVVEVTIGLFTIIRLFRIVNLLVESKGFCIPEECEERCPLNPCEFFESLDFPMDIFSPPQKPEFFAGSKHSFPNPHGGCECDEVDATDSK
jgi:hypothetical protein